MVGKGGDSISFRAADVTLLPYPEPVIALVILAFATDQPMELYREAYQGGGRRGGARREHKHRDQEDYSEEESYGDLVRTRPSSFARWYG